MNARSSSVRSARLDPVDDLARSDDGDALMHTDGQQMLAVAGDDQLGARGDGRWYADVSF